MTITALPDAPSRSDTPADFITKADAFVAALAVLVTEMNAAISTVNMTKWITGTTYAVGDVVWSPADFQAYRRKTAGAGTTDPSTDSTNWQRTEVSETSLQNQTYTAYTTAGTSTAYTLTPTPAVAALAENQEFDVEFHTAAGDTPTLAISGLTAKSLKYRNSAGTKTAVTSSQVPTGWRSRVTDDGTDYIVREVPPEANPVPIFTAAYVSSNQTISNAGLLTLAHGLGVAPKIVQFFAICLTGEYNWTAGEIIPIAGAGNTFSGAGGVAVGFAADVSDATNITVRFAAQANPIVALDATSGALQSLTSANWALIVRAYA